MGHGEADLQAAQSLRHLCLIEARGLPSRRENLDADPFDATFRHLLVEDADGQLLATARLRVTPDGRGLAQGYAAATHDLARLRRFPAPTLELGRLCARPGPLQAQALRAAWALLARIALDHRVALLIGCSSLDGADPAPHAPALALLARDHLAPARWAPRAKAPETLDITLLPAPPDRLAALRGVPAPLRSYLAMGAWVGRHAVIDRDLDTLQLLTAVEVARVPPARARALHALAG